MCRAMSDGRLEIAAHPGAHPSGVGIPALDLGTDSGQLLEGLIRVLVKRRDSHHAAELELFGGDHAVGQGWNGGWVSASTGSVRGGNGRWVEIDLQEHLKRIP